MGLALTPFPGLRQMAVFSALGTGLCLAHRGVLVSRYSPAAGTLRASRLAQAFGASRARWPLLRANRAGFAALALFSADRGIGIFASADQRRYPRLAKSAGGIDRRPDQAGPLLDAPTPVQFYLVRADTVEQLLQREEALQDRLRAADPAQDHQRLPGYFELGAIAPAAAGKPASWRRTALLAEDGPLPAIARQIGEDPAWIATLQAAIAAPQTPLTPENFLQTAAGEPSRYLWLGQVGAKYASIVALRGLNDYANLPLLAQAADPVQEVQWVDKVGEISGVLGSYRRYMGWAAVGAYLAIFALLFWRYRAAAWRVLLPPALASIATLAMLGLLALPLQLFHILALMLILGLGVDYGIFLREEPDRRDRYAWLAVGLSAVSALLAFGLLALSQTPPLHAFGLTMLIGMASVWLIAPCTASATSATTTTTTESINKEKEHE